MTDEQCRVYIYALKDPGTLATRYIGRTTHLQRRKRQHVLSARYPEDSPMADWIARILQTKGDLPLEVLEDVPFDVAGDREAFHMERCHAEGCHLFNTLGARSTEHLRQPRRQVFHILELAFNDKDLERLRWLCERWELGEVGVLRRLLLEEAERAGKDVK